ncbi:MAG TPA: HAD family phosphatase [Candidatus Limnocylindrales bacterium]|nr:HAD family phosphatase [Candidatus Limnocylindrales bacterium]
MDVAAVIFDLDGVLLDSEVWWDDVRRDFVAAHGRTWTADDQRAVMGANSAGWARTMVERHGLGGDPEHVLRAVVDGVVQRYRREGPPVIPGVAEGVARLAARYPLAVASSSHPEVIRAALESSGLGQFFGVVVSSDEVARGKPAPDVFVLAAERLGAPAPRIVVVEDSLNGVVAAKSAGMAVVLVPNASVPPQPGASEEADLVVPSVAAVDPEAVLAAAGG